MYNIPIIMPYIPLLRGLLLRHVLAICLSLIWTLLWGTIQWWMDIAMQRKPQSSSRRSNWFIKLCRNNSKGTKLSIRLCMTSIRLIIISNSVIKFDYISTKNILKVKEKNSNQLGMVCLQFEKDWWECFSVRFTSIFENAYQQRIF